MYWLLLNSTSIYKILDLGLEVLIIGATFINWMKKVYMWEYAEPLLLGLEGPEAHVHAQLEAVSVKEALDGKLC